MLLISRKITTHRLFPPWWTRLTWSLKTSFRGNLMWHFEHGVQASFCITLGWLTLIWATRCWASENSQLHAEHLTKKVDNIILIFWRWKNNFVKTYLRNWTKTSLAPGSTLTWTTLSFSLAGIASPEMFCTNSMILANANFFLN